MNPHTLDFILLGIAIYVLLRILRRRNTPPDKGRPRLPGEDHHDDDTPERPDAEQPAYRNARNTWDALRSRPNGPQQAQRPTRADDAPPMSGSDTVPVPTGFDESDFLDGAKAVFARMQESWARRDLEDIAHFTTPAVLDEITRHAQADPTPSPVEVLLIKAQLLEVKQEHGQTRCTVHYDVLLRQGRSRGEPTQVREIWTFARTDNDPGSLWKLDAIQQPQ
ncbi:MAG: Tim44 domain-containing protein [Desulfovibrionaceae bacterium]